MGDERTYGHPIIIRAVTSDDAMTADWARLPYDVLETMSQPDHQRGAGHQPGRLRHHVEAAGHDRMGVTRRDAVSRDAESSAVRNTFVIFARLAQVRYEAASSASFPVALVIALLVPAMTPTIASAQTVDGPASRRSSASSTSSSDSRRSRTSSPRTTSKPSTPSRSSTRRSSTPRRRSPPRRPNSTSSAASLSEMALRSYVGGGAAPLGPLFEDAEQPERRAAARRARPGRTERRRCHHRRTRCTRRRPRRRARRPRPQARAGRRARRQPRRRSRKRPRSRPSRLRGGQAPMPRPSSAI